MLPLARPSVQCNVAAHALGTVSQQAARLPYPVTLRGPPRACSVAANPQVAASTSRTDGDSYSGASAVCRADGATRWEERSRPVHTDRSVANGTTHFENTTRPQEELTSASSNDRSNGDAPLIIQGQGAVRPGSSTEGGQPPDPDPLVEDTTAGNWLTPLRRPGSVVALGKFDALHRGHRALAVAAASLARQLAALPAAADDDNPASVGSTSCSDDRSASCAAAAAGFSGTEAEAELAPWARPHGQGLPNRGAHADGDSNLRSVPGGASADGGDAAGGDAVLLSFSGMAAVLGWPDRLPLTAPQDRGRVLAGWAAACATAAGDGAATTAAPRPPRLRTLPFSLIRGMSPEEFVALLARDLGAAGVVAGRNYRFGYKASGDADTLVRLGRKYGMQVQIVDLVTLPDSDDGNGADAAAGTSVANVTRTTDASAAANFSSSSSAGGGNGAGEVGAASASNGAAVAPRRSGGRLAFASEASTDLDVELPAGAASAAFSVAGAGGSGSCERVSSSRIRELLAGGRVEAVESLLGRKYRLVCHLTAGCGAAPALTSSEAGPVASIAGAAAGGSDAPGSAEGGTDLDAADSTSCGGLFVPHSTYQNQPPASGQYRALVQLFAPAGTITGVMQLTSGSGTDDVWGADAAEGQPSGTQGPWLDAGGAACDGTGTGLGSTVFGPTCVTVTLGDAGLHVDSANIGAGLELLGAGMDGAFLLVDFDACG